MKSWPNLIVSDIDLVVNQYCLFRSALLVQPLANTDYQLSRLFSVSINYTDQVVELDDYGKNHIQLF